MIQMNLSIKQTPDIENNLAVAKEEWRWGRVEVTGQGQGYRSHDYVSGTGRAPSGPWYIL